MVHSECLAVLQIYHIQIYDLLMLNWPCSATLPCTKTHNAISGLNHTLTPFWVTFLNFDPTQDVANNITTPTFIQCACGTCTV